MGLNIVKSKIIEAGFTMSKVVEMLQDSGDLRSLQNLSQKLSRGTLKYTEAEKIAEIIGYEIVWRKKPAE